jgi:hypothetical protein
MNDYCDLPPAPTNPDQRPGRRNLRVLILGMPEQATSLKNEMEKELQSVLSENGEDARHLRDRTEQAQLLIALARVRAKQFNGFARRELDSSSTRLPTLAEIEAQLGREFADRVRDILGFQDDRNGASP